MDTRIVALLTAAALLLAACVAPRVQSRGTEPRAPRLDASAAIMDDGYRLPLRRWGSDDGARTVVLAVHGFNDYSNAFAGLGSALAQQQIVTYAYDQRGFGNSARRGLWAGTGRMIADLRTLLHLLRRRHPGLPMILIGESMGGALVIAAGAVPHLADGAVLIAPAVWSREQMPAYQRAALWAIANTLPWLELTGDGLDIRPSDNLEMLRALGADPLVIKRTRADALWGISNLMDLAASSVDKMRGPLLVLYGEHDEIIPRPAFCRMLGALPDAGADIDLALYQQGWHMLTRDLQGSRVIADVVAWINDPREAAPLRHAVDLQSERLQQLCARTPGWGTARGAPRNAGECSVAAGPISCPDRRRRYSWSSSR